MTRFLLLLALALPIAAQTQPHATIVAGTPDPVTGTVPFQVTIVNPLPQQISVNFRPAVRQLPSLQELPITGSNPWACPGSTDPNCVVYTQLPANSQATYDMAFTFPARAGRAYIQGLFQYAVEMEQHGGFTDRIFVDMFRLFDVTTTADNGEGSLRNAILAVNADPVCAAELPCRIEFHLPNAGPWQTIAPLTPLPRLITGDVELDATTQADTNPLGPDVQLLGSNLQTGDAFDIQADLAVVRGFAIGGFPGSGIFYRTKQFGSGFTFERNYIGVDPTGAVPVHNGTRGITVEGGVVQNGFIRDNVLSGNGRSGIYIVTERNQFLPTSPVLEITNNRIGVAAHSDAPIPNHASGIFLGPASEQVLVENNVIAYNRHFGVAIARAPVAHHVVSKNRMFRNEQSGIDIGLDGPDAFGRPVLVSATYDAVTNTTVIRGNGFVGSFGALYAMIYASADAEAEGEEYLGEVLANGPYELRVTGDYRGKYITAVYKTVLDLTFVDTGEMGDPIPVQ